MECTGEIMQFDSCFELSPPLFSVILPVWRESSIINASISRLLEQKSSGGVEIIVVDGEQSGSTIKIITAGCVRKTICERGRARQMNNGATIARGEILVFLHVDTLLPAEAFLMIQKTMSDRRVVAGAFDLGFDTNRRIFKITERYVHLRTRLTRVPFGDQAIFIRSGYFQELGGYRNIPIMEDVELMRRIRRRGDSIALISAKVITSPRRYTAEGILYCTLRNLTLQILYCLGVPPERLERWYRR